MNTTQESQPSEGNGTMASPTKIYCWAEGNGEWEGEGRGVPD